MPYKMTHWHHITLLSICADKRNHLENAITQLINEDVSSDEGTPLDGRPVRKRTRKLAFDEEEDDDTSRVAHKRPASKVQFQQLSLN